MKLRKLSATLLALTLAISLLAGCTGSGDEESSSDASSSTPGSDTSAVSKDKTVGDVLPDFSQNVEESFEENEDTVGWLQVPDTSIEDVVVQKADDYQNEYYRRRDFYGNDFFDGVYYADFRSSFGDGTREGLGVNTTIYGHSMTDDVESERYGVKFGPLHDFRDPALAEHIPYIFFSTGKETMAFEVFAVFVANADNPEIPYNSNVMGETSDVLPEAVHKAFAEVTPTQEDFVKMVKEQVLPRSKYNYDVEIKDDDKFLTLSTCIYTLDNGTVTNYPNTYYRYAVMGRLVDPGEPLKEKAVFTENTDVLYDPDGKMATN